ncbi:hypothetical protein [Catellatospora sp. NPDC049609]|uniref:hypothetical protein n=1 Tax=Catellatospora sp. NPDC049609 TaxID=3155505 RepID=UPI0034449C14
MGEFAAAAPGARPSPTSRMSPAEQHGDGRRDGGPDEQVAVQVAGVRSLFGSPHRAATLGA